MIELKMVQEIPGLGDTYSNEYGTWTVGASLFVDEKIASRMTQDYPGAFSPLTAQPSAALSPPDAELRTSSLSMPKQQQRAKK
jgi:hypothetical protein